MTQPIGKVQLAFEAKVHHLNLTKIRGSETVYLGQPTADAWYAWRWARREALDEAEELLAGQSAEVERLKGELINERERSALVCEGRAESLSASESYLAANEAGKCAAAIRSTPFKYTPPKG